MQLARHARQRLEQDVGAFLLDQARHAEDRHRMARIAAVVGAAHHTLCRKAFEIDAVIDQLDASGGRERCQVVAIGARAGHEPLALGELLALFPFRRGPDVLGVRRAAPGQRAQDRGIARDRRRRMQEVGMQPRHVARQLRGEHQRLSEAADAVGRRVAPQVAQPLGARFCIGR